MVAELPTLITRGATGTTKAMIVAAPPDPDGAATMTVGLDSVTLPDFGADVVDTPSIVVVVT